MPKKPKELFQGDGSLTLEAKHAIKSLMKEALEEHKQVCPLPFDAAENLGHMFGMVKDIGGGGKDGIEKGIENMRSNYKYFTGLRQWNTKIADYVLKTVVGAMALGILYAIWNAITGKG